MCAITLYLQDTSFWFVQLFLDDFIILCDIEDITLDTSLWHNVFWIVLCLGLHEYSSDSNIFKLLKYSNYIHLARMKCINFSWAPKYVIELRNKQRMKRAATLSTNWSLSGVSGCRPWCCYSSPSDYGLVPGPRNVLHSQWVTVEWSLCSWREWKNIRRTTLLTWTSRQVVLDIDSYRSRTFLDIRMFTPETVIGSDGMFSRRHDDPSQINSDSGGLRRTRLLAIHTFAVSMHDDMSDESS